MHFRYNLTLCAHSVTLLFLFRLPSFLGTGFHQETALSLSRITFFSCLLIFFTVFFNCLFNCFCFWLSVCFLLLSLWTCVCFTIVRFVSSFFGGQITQVRLQYRKRSCMCFFLILHCSTFLLIRSPCRIRNDGRSCSGGKQITHFSWFLNLNNFDKHQLCILRRRIHLKRIYYNRCGY